VVDVEDLGFTTGFELNGGDGFCGDFSGKGTFERKEESVRLGFGSGLTFW